MELRQAILGRVAPCAVLLLLLVLTTADPALADGPNRAALILQYGDGRTETRCVEFGEPQISGLDLLQRAGLDVLADPNGGAVCRLQNQGCNFPTQPCFCQCQGATCIYWSYWRLANNVWQYSSKGATISTVHNGDVDGWIWGPGTITSAVPPPMVAFDQVCPLPTTTPSPTSPTSPTLVPPTDTPVPPTSTRRPAATRAPRTHTPSPTDTPIPTLVATEVVATDLPPAGDTPMSGGALPAETSVPAVDIGPGAAAATLSADDLAQGAPGQLAELPGSAGGQEIAAAEAGPVAPAEAPPGEAVATQGEAEAAPAVVPESVPAQPADERTQAPPAPTFRPTRSGPTPTPLLRPAPVVQQTRDAKGPGAQPGSLLTFGLFLAAGAAAMVYIVVRR